MSSFHFLQTGICGLGPHVLPKVLCQRSRLLFLPWRLGAEVRAHQLLAPERAENWMNSVEPCKVGVGGMLG